MVLPKPWTGLDVDEFMKIINRNAMTHRRVPGDFTASRSHNSHDHAPVGDAVSARLRSNKGQEISCGLGCCLRHCPLERLCIYGDFCTGADNTYFIRL